MGITTDSDKAGGRITASGETQHMTRFTVGDMSDRAGVEDVNISFFRWSNQTITSGFKLSGKSLYLRLV